MEAYKKFDEWIKKACLTNAEVADKLNWYNSSLAISPESVRQWRSGIVGSRLRIRPTITALTGIKSNCRWL